MRHHKITEGASANRLQRRRVTGSLLLRALSVMSVPAAGAAPGGELGREDAVIAAARAATFVLLGEATHGTSEFYSERAKVTGRLLNDHRPSAVVIEADVTEVEQVNRFVRGIGPDRTAAEALTSFRRFPRWMWRNADFAEFVEALRTANLRRREAERVGLYGMDVYDLYGALDRVRAYVRHHLPRGAAAAANAVAKCLAPYRRNTEAYGIASRKATRSCAAPAQALLNALRHAPLGDAVPASEERFAALQAAAALVDGEAYFHAAFAGAYSWNVRERSMTASIKRVAAHAAGQDGAARVIVWTHNSHVARAASTTMADRGEASIADLLREGGDPVFAMGLLTHSGTFMAAPAWDRPGQVYRLKPAARNSVEGLLRRSGEERSVLMLGAAAPDGHSDWRPQRGVGAVYDARLPEAVYGRVRLATEFDAVTLLDKTKAVTPLP
jgi:erythromycin esterase-like protein